MRRFDTIPNDSPRRVELARGARRDAPDPGGEVGAIVAERLMVGEHEVKEPVCRVATAAYLRNG